jgi:hypothetical protein
MQTYLDSVAARDYIRKRGVKIGDNSLKDHRSRGTGPQYVFINGRVAYTAEWCDRWIAEQAARPIVRRGRSDRTAA